MIKKVSIFTCDYCNEQTIHPSLFGFPKGFVYLNPDVTKGRHEITHLCPNCKTGNKDEKVPE